MFGELNAQRGLSASSAGGNPGFEARLRRVVRLALRGLVLAQREVAAGFEGVDLLPCFEWDLFPEFSKGDSLFGNKDQESQEKKKGSLLQEIYKEDTLFGNNASEDKKDEKNTLFGNND